MVSDFRRFLKAGKLWISENLATGNIRNLENLIILKMFWKLWKDVLENLKMFWMTNLESLAGSLEREPEPAC